MSVSEQLENQEGCKSSFLKELIPDVYDLVIVIRPFIFIYASLLLIFFVLSYFFHSSIIKYFIDIMMGWTIPSLLLTLLMIVICDIKVTIRNSKEIIQRITPARYRLSMYWFFFLCLAGIAYLYLSNQYKQEYDFKCSNFYLEDSTGIYHIWDDCNYIGIDENGNQTGNKNISKVRGYELNDWQTPCIACEERAEDYKSDFAY